MSMSEDEETKKLLQFILDDVASDSGGGASLPSLVSTSAAATAANIIIPQPQVMPAFSTSVGSIAPLPAGLSAAVMPRPPYNLPNAGIGIAGGSSPAISDGATDSYVEAIGNVFSALKKPVKLVKKEFEIVETDKNKDILGTWS